MMLKDNVLESKVAEIVIYFMAQDARSKCRKPQAEAGGLGSPGTRQA